MVYLPRRVITILTWWEKRMFHDINKKTFGLEIIFLLDPVIEQVNMDTNLLPIKYFEPAAHMYTEVQRLNNGKYKF